MTKQVHVRPIVPIGLIIAGLVPRAPLSNEFRSSSSQSGSADVSSTTYTAAGLTAGQYYFRVAARNTIGYSGFCELTGNTCAGAAVSVTIA